MFYILAKSPEERNKLLRYLDDNGVNAVFHYVPLRSSLADRKFGRLGSTMDITNNISNRLLRLPMYYEMTDDDVDLVAAMIERFYS